MTFSVFNDRYGLVSRLWIKFSFSTVKDFVQEMTIDSHEIPLAAWNLTLSQRQEFWNNDRARVRATANQQGTMEIRDELPSTVGAHDLEGCGYHASDQVDIDFQWNDPDLSMDEFFRAARKNPILFQLPMFPRWEQRMKNHSNWRRAI